MDNVLLALGVSLLTVVLGMTVTAIRIRQLDKAAVVDVTWGAGFVLVALVAAVVATASGEGEAWHRWLLVAMVAVWGGRLAWHVRSRATGDHGGKEDPRYAEMLGGTVSEVGIGTVVRRVLLVQGVAQWFIAIPVAISAFYGVEIWPAVVVGVLVWGTGLFFETVGDRQLAAYKEIPKVQRPQVMETGLWAWTRHPNYFGDATVWWGLWLVGGLASGWVVGLATILCPIAMTFFIRNVTGAVLLERTMMQRPGFPEYAERVPMFFPRPPQRA
jgi:steroid 5-alpha reductase family enzyme